jgi:3-methyl-2-oxobutanoate hydroxymethyltransferase
MDIRKPLTIPKLLQMKQQANPITVITAYDYPSARLAEQAGIDVILVGDSVGNVVLGYDSTIPVTIDDMVYHTRAVRRGATQTFVIADMPFFTYHASLDATMNHVARLMQEGHAHAVKLEGGAEIANTVKHIVNAGVPVVGHLGLTPQSVHQLGGYRIQGRHLDEITRIVHDAEMLVEAGVCAIVLELVTEELATWLTQHIRVPTIGIGSGSHCDGQVLVFHDMMQYHAETTMKKFVKTYADLHLHILSGIQQYVQEVKTREFPSPAHSYEMDTHTKLSFQQWQSTRNQA